MVKKYKTLKEFLDNLDEPRKAEVNELREIIKNSNTHITEHLKWNSPSYYLHEDDRITFNMHNKDCVRLVFHAGTKRKEDKSMPPIFHDDTGLFEWNSNIRATVTFNDLAHIQNKQEDLTRFITKWLAIFG